MRIRVVVAELLALAVVVGGLVGFGIDRTPDPVFGQVQVQPATTGLGDLSGRFPDPKPTVPVSYTVARPNGADIQLFDQPDVPATVSGTRTHQDGWLDNPTWEGLPLVLLVREEQADWIRVEVNTRPNEREAWVRRADVTLSTVPNRVVVELGARKATVYHGDQEVFSTVVAVGRPSAPTPTGNFYVDGVVKLTNPNGAYGAAQLSVSAFSDVYQQFGGGLGQIAMHGTNAPGLLGQAVSHGCIRMDNPSVLRMLDLAPPGTPVEIRP